MVAEKAEDGLIKELEVLQSVIPFGFVFTAVS